MPMTTPASARDMFSSKQKKHSTDECMTSSTEFPPFHPVLCLQFIYFISTAALPVNYMWFLKSLGEDGVAGQFPSCRTLIAEMETFAATSEQDVDRKSSYKGGLAAGGLILCLCFPKRETKSSYGNTIQSNH